MVPKGALRFLLFAQVIWILMLLHFSAAQDPCLEGNYMELGQVSKRSPTYAMDASPLCDRYLTKRWYRAKDHVMSTSPPSLAFCGTLYPVWLQDPVPADGLTETLTACQVGFTETCSKSYGIDVKNCSSFIVYELEALDTCNSAYCFELDSACVNDSVENIQVSFHNVSWTEDKKGPVTQYDPHVNMICSFTPADDDSLLYHIDWYVDNNTLIKSQTVDKTSLENAILSADDINKAGKKIGIWIQCIVGLIKSEDKLPCLTSPSTLFFAGIEVLNQTLTIERQGQSSIMVRPTIPFGSETIDFGGQSTSSLNIQLSFVDGVTKANCQATGGLARCSIEIPSYKYDDRDMYDDTANWYKIYEMTVYNSDEENYYLHDHRLVLRLETNSPAGNGAQIFGDVVLPDVYINIVESEEEWKGKRCSSYIDPHLTTFDGVPFECQSTGCLTGKTYVFYKNSAHLQEVQVRHANCWGWPRCACAIAARSGQDVFTLDFCGSKRYVNFPVCRDKSLKVIKESDKIYKIVFPTGTYVKVMLYDYGSWYMNIEVYPTIADVKSTSGLCGFLDGDTTNDFRLPDQTVSTSNPPDDFSLSWKLSDGSPDDLLSYSQSIYDSLTPLSTYFQKLCSCDDGKTYCSYKKYKDCETMVKGKEYHCILHTSARKRRDLEFIHNIHRREQQSDTLVKRSMRRKRQVISVSEAQDSCYRVFEQSELYGTCLQVVPNFSNESVENCVMDLSMTGEENLTQIHLQTALGQCQTYISLNSTLKKEQANFSEIMINLCPNNCSSNGICSGGNCTCNNGFGGSDCSFNILSPPTITRISDDGLCDKSEESCDGITLYGQYFLENMGTTCHFDRQEITETKNISSQESYTVNLEERTLYEGYCRLVYPLTNTWSTTFYFKLSNDGTQFTETYSVYIYQSQCQIFNNNTGSVYFTLQDGYCFINGSCVQRGEFKSNDSSFKCDPDMHRYDWTYDGNTTVSTTQSTTTTTSSVPDISTSTAPQTTPVNVATDTSTAPQTTPVNIATDTSTAPQTTHSISSSIYATDTTSSHGISSTTVSTDTTSTTAQTSHSISSSTFVTQKTSTAAQTSDSISSSTVATDATSTSPTTTSQLTSQSTASQPPIPSSSDSITSRTTSPTSNDRNNTANKNRNTKQDSKLSDVAIGLISAVAFVTIAIISLGGYLLKAKCSKRQDDQIASLSAQDTHAEISHGREIMPTGDDQHNIFDIRPDDLISRPPTATSMARQPPTNDLRRVFDQEHLDNMFSVTK